MESESLHPQIIEAQKALALALERACKVDVEEVDTGELIRVEETLAVASQAAKQAVSLRLRRRNQRAVSSDSDPEIAPVATHRVFDDIRGKRWRAFAVHPSAATVERAALPEAFRQGWLSFESENEMRRVAPIPENWLDLSIEDLRLLCYRAGPAPKRINNLGAGPQRPKPRAEQ